MNRITEPSTWAGFAGIFQAMKFFMPPTLHLYMDGATAIAGAIAAMVPEKAAADVSAVK